MKKIKTEKGFSLLETLLTTTLIAGVMVIVFQILQDYAERSIARSTAQYMAKISESVEIILDDADYFSRIYALADAQPSDILELSFTDLINGFGTAPNDIPASPVLNAGVRDQTPLNTGIMVMVRVADNPVDPTDTETLEVFVTSDAPIAHKRLRNAAQYMGPQGGFFRDPAEGIESAFNAWQFNDTIFANTAFAGVIGTTPPSVDDGGYLVHYKHISFDDITGDYLYRERVAGQPELNQMHTAINMGGNNILGIDNADLSGNLDLSAKAIVNGAAAIGGNTSLTNANLTANNRLTAANGTIRGEGSGNRGNFAVDGALDLGTLAASNRVSATDATFENGIGTTGELRTRDIEFVQGFNTGTVNTTSLINNGSDVTVNVNGQLKAATIETDNLTVGGNGNIGTIDAEIGGNLDVTGTVTAPRIGFGTLDVVTFGACDQGC